MVDDLAIIMRQGTDKDPSFIFKDPDGTVVNITGGTITFDLYDKEGGTLQFTKTTPTDVEITDGPAGKFAVHIVPADTSSLTVGTYWFLITIVVGADTRKKSDYLKLKQG